MCETVNWPLVRVAGERRPRWPEQEWTIRDLCREIGRLNDIIAALEAENRRLTQQQNQTCS